MTLRFVTMPPARAALATLVCAMALAACTSSPPDDAPPTERVQAIEQARSDVGEPAEALGTAVAALATRVDAAAAMPDAARVQAVLDATAELRAAHDTAASVELAGEVPDVIAAAEAWQAGVTAAATMEETATEVATVLAQVVEVDAQLADIVAGWNERGSRSEVITRFEEAAATADDIAARTGPPTCRDPMQTRVAAAAFIAEASRDLAELVQARDGTGLDERRAELAEAPYGVTDDDQPRRLDVALAVDECDALERLLVAGDAVMEALDDLQEALNPSDLADG